MGGMGEVMGLGRAWAWAWAWAGDARGHGQGISGACTRRWAGLSGAGMGGAWAWARQGGRGRMQQVMCNGDMRAGLLQSRAELPL